MKLLFFFFTERAGALSNRAVVVFNEASGTHSPPTAPAARLPARPPALLPPGPPSPTGAQGIVFWSPAGGEGAYRVGRRSAGGGGSVGARVAQCVRAGASAGGGAGGGASLARLPTPALRSARPCDPGLRLLAPAESGPGPRRAGTAAVAAWSVRAGTCARPRERAR